MPKIVEECLELLADNRVKVALIALIMSVAVFFGAPKDKQDAASNIIIAGNGLAAVVILVLGKKTPPTTGGSPPAAGGAATLLLLPLLAFGSFGCQTSEQFKIGAHAAGPVLADAATHYVVTDTTLDDLTRSQRLAESDALRTSTAVESEIARSVVEPRWGQVRPWYSGYVNIDPLLNDRERLLRQLVISEFDRLIDNDGSRPLAKLGGSSSPPLSPLLNPPSPKPATRPAPQVVPDSALDLLRPH